MSKFISVVLAGDTMTANYTTAQGAAATITGTVINANAQCVWIMDNNGKTQRIEWRNISDFDHQKPPVNDPARYDSTLL